MLIFVAYAMGAVLSASSTLLYVYGNRFLTSKFVSDFKYKESCMFLQISNSSAILIFNARTQGFSFLSVPAPQLFMSAVVSQIFVNCVLLFADGFITEQLAGADMIRIWLYDLSWLVIIDLVKMGINKLQEEPQAGVNDENTSRNSFARTSKAGKAASSKLSKDIRVSATGMPMPKK